MDETQPLEAEAEARSLAEEGLREARAIGHPIARARHLAAWAFRLAVWDADAALALAAEHADAVDQTELLVTAVSDRLRRPGLDPEPFLTQTIERAAQADADTGLRLLNVLSERAIELADRAPAAAVAWLRRLAPVARGLTLPDTEMQQHRALGCALVGEALLALGDDEGEALLHEAEHLASSFPHRDPLLSFLAGALSDRDPERVARLLGEMEDPGGRLENRLQLLSRLDASPLRAEVAEQAQQDAFFLEHYRGPESVVRLAQVLAPVDPERSRSLFSRALEAAEKNGAQVRSLQFTGVASAVSGSDRAWAGELFAQAVQAAQEEEEPVRRITALVVAADEMAASHPREAAAVFQQAMAEAPRLEAMWELAHVLDVVFRSDRSEFLDVSAARPLVEQVLDRIADTDPHLPGMLGLPEAARYMLQLDRDAGVQVLQRWYEAAEANRDAHGMTQAALSISQVDAGAGRQALEAARDLLVKRIDCPSMGEFSRSVAAVAPDLVLSVASLIPDARERADAHASAALALYAEAPDQSLSLIREMERPVDRSLALLMLVDGLLGTGDRPQPQPLLEEMP